MALAQDNTATRLLQEIELNLSEGRRLRFSPAMEMRFEADTGRQRNRDLVIAGLIALLVYNLFIFNDYAIRPEVVTQALWLRLGLITPVGLLALWCVGRGIRPEWRETIMASMVVMAMCVSSVIFLISRSPQAIFDPFSFSLIVLGGNIVFSLRFRYALLSTIVCLILMAAFLWSYPPMPVDVKVFALLVAASTGVFTLASNYRLERSERQSYLLLLRETLRASSVLQDNQALTKISYTDALTKLANRRQFDETFAMRWHEAVDTGAKIALLIIDVDHFKAYNDLHGHPKGDACLAQVAAAMQRQVRTELDLVARLGGEEFAVLLPGSHAASALLAGERIRNAVEALRIPHNGVAGQSIVTVSVGVSVISPMRDRTSDELLAQADKALYLAKRNGRNQVQMAAA